MAISPEQLGSIASMSWRITPAAMASFLTRDAVAHERFMVPRHIDYLSTRIALSANGHGSKFLIANMPPQHGKSHLVSTWTPAWYLERFPHRHVALGAYAGDFAAGWGRKVRDIINRYSGQLGVSVSQVTSAADEWETNAGGGMLCVGVGGGITGRPADGLLIVDDPYKDAREANSPTIRENVWEWFTQSVMTRRHPQTVVLLIHTRWHPDDLTGRLLSRMDADPSFPRFDIINLPAIAEDGDVLGRGVGEALWPERWDMEFIKQQHKVLGSYAFNAMYQQRPLMPEGGRFRREWFSDFAPRVPAGLVTSCVRSWDLAATMEGEKGNRDPDWTVGVRQTLVNGINYIDDVIRVRSSAMNVERLVRATADRDGHGVRIRMQQDPGQGGKMQVSHYARRLLVGWDFRGVISTLDKVTRAGAFEAACERGDVKLVQGAWNDEFVNELCTFPMAKHDDQVDACTIGYNDLVAQASSWGGKELGRLFSYNRRPGRESVEELLAEARGGVYN